MLPGRDPLRALLGAACLVALGGCGGPQVKITVQPSADTNGRSPCYLLVRKVDARKYVEEPYQKVAALVLEPDETVLGSALVFPDVPQDVSVTPPKEGQMAIYVFFTNPDGDWRTLLPASPPGEVRLKLVSSHLSSSAK